MALKLAPERRVKWFHSPFQHETKLIDGKQSFTTLGYFTSDNVDETGDQITKDATVGALPQYRKFRNVRFMHQPEPVAKAIRIGLEEGLEWNQVECKVADPKTQNLIDQDVLSAMSVGVIIEEAEPMDDSENAFGFYWGPLKITKMKLVEISYVDHPANYDAVLTGANSNTQAEVQQRIMKWASTEGIPLTELELKSKDIAVIQEEPSTPTTGGSLNLDKGQDMEGKEEVAPEVTETKSEVVTEVQAIEHEIQATEPEVKKEMDSEMSSKMDAMMSKMDTMMSKMDEMMSKMGTMEDAVEPEVIKTEPVEEKKIEEKTEQPAEVKGVVEAEPAEDDTGILNELLNKTIKAAFSEHDSSLDKKLDERDEKSFVRVKEYVESLRTPQQGKAQVISTEEEEKKEEKEEHKSLTEEEIKKLSAEQRRNLIKTLLSRKTETKE